MTLRIWLTGYRSYELSVFSEQDPKLIVIKKALKAAIIQLAENVEECWVLSGAQLGVEQWGQECVTELKKDYPQLKSALILPYQNFGHQWQAQNQTKLAHLMEHVDFSLTLNRSDYRNRDQLVAWQHFMLKHTDEALLLYDLEHPGKSDYDWHMMQRWQQQHNYTIQWLDFYTLQDTANELNEQNYD